MSELNYFERASENALVELAELAIQANPKKATRLISEACRGVLGRETKDRLWRLTLDIPTQTK